jgi:hypothetical protein
VNPPVPTFRPPVARGCVNPSFEAKGSATCKRSAMHTHADGPFPYPKGPPTDKVSDSRNIRAGQSGRERATNVAAGPNFDPHDRSCILGCSTSRLCSHRDVLVMPAAIGAERAFP